MRWLLEQFRALLGYLVVPFMCFLLPRRPAAAVASWFSRRRRLIFARESTLALTNARQALDIEDTEAWAAEWRLIRLLDAIDAWHGLFSSDRRIARLVEQRGDWPEPGRVIAVGTHSGPATLVLRSLAAAGYAPRLVYRDDSQALLRRAPVLAAYAWLRVRYTRKACRGGAIATPGGRKRFEAAIDEDGSAPVLLVDVPGNGRGEHRVPLFGQELQATSRGLLTAQARGALFSFYTIWWDAEHGRRVLEIAPPQRFANDEALLAAAARFVTRTVEARPAQWQLWLTEAPVLRPPAKAAAGEDQMRGLSGSAS